MKFEIIFEDQEILVVYKAAGVPTESKNVAQADMVTELANYRVKNKEKPEVYVVHRLDQPVEGIMVFAKTKEAANALTKQIKDHVFVKKYYAIITREQFPEEGVLEDYMVKDGRTNTSKVVSSNDPRAKKAKLSYKTVAQWDDRKLLDIQLYTGRHHQIRLQLASRTAPILGDVKYGGIKTGRNLALCSYSLGFRHPKTNKELNFSISPKGEDFVDCSLFK